MSIITDTATHHGPAAHDHSHTSIGLGAAALGALGVVFGDIGTSPLYALQVALKATGHAQPSVLDLFGTASLIFWALALTVAIKYVSLVLRADNDGEGGILALLALVTCKTPARPLPFLALLGALGAALLIGDGMITPSISVLSATEGVKVIAPNFAPYVVPTTVAILIALFSIQSRGTGAIGRFFGPIMIAWFAVIAVLGLNAIRMAPQILAAVDPRYALHFMIHDPSVSFGVFGAIFLCLTGGEALYADLGHFGAKPIRLSWFAIVMPALLLNYFGQAALLLNKPEAVDNPFFKLAPDWGVLPLTILATAATIIASQALITGVYSLVYQAIQMNLWPRMRILNPTSHAGQIYIPVVNWLLALGTLAITLAFRSSDSLAAAYGIAVSGTMLITTILLLRLMLGRWHWHPAIAFLVAGFFALIDATFLVANSLKFLDGGWLPLAVAGFITFLMTSWRFGTAAVRQQLDNGAEAVDQFLAKLDALNLERDDRTIVVLTKLTEQVSPIVLQMIRHFRCLPRHVVLMSVVTERRPRVPAAERLDISDLGHGFSRVIVRVGFKQHPDIMTALNGCERLNLGINRHEATFLLGHEDIVRRRYGSVMAKPFWAAYSFMSKLSGRTSSFFRLPPEQVCEIGLRLEI